MNMTNFNRFQEPEDPQFVTYDWEGNSIFEGDRYVEAERGCVLIDDVERYLRVNNLIQVAEVQK